MTKNSTAVAATIATFGDNYLMKCLDVLYGAGSGENVAKSNILVVGAGGVGCELLKNLACNGFRKVTVIDLDTIDVSNLNRQFLFRREHVGKSKAEMASIAIQKMYPNMQINGIVANIKNSKFDIPFYKSFNLVCNALDNIDARRHVNRICLAANVPLIESGSTGYMGQVSIHVKGYECYDCIEKKPQKAIAVCTIRSTPEKPVHCIVWAKSLWDLIFGPDDDGNVLADLDGGTETNTVMDADMEKNTADDSTNGNVESTGNAMQIVDKDANVVDIDASPNNISRKANTANSTTENTKSVESISVRKKPAKRVRYAHPEPANDFADRVCARIFVDDIAEQAAMKTRWKDRAPPIVFDVATAAKSLEKIDMENVNLLEQRHWDRDECARILYATLLRVVEKRKEQIGTISFDKDDNDALAFVVAAANLRAVAYGVPLSSPFEVKGIAGNIIHAIATTNAVVGGLVVQEALKIITSGGKVEKCLPAYIAKHPGGSRVRRLINSLQMQKPKKNCYVCSKGQLQLMIDVEVSTLRMLVDNVLKSRLSVAEPSIYLAAGSTSDILYECGEGLMDDEIEDYEANLCKSLKDLHVTSGVQLSIEDMKQDLKCVIHVTHQSGCEDDKPIAQRFLLAGATPVASKENGIISTGVRASDKSEVVDVDENDLSIVEPSASSKGLKPKPEGKEEKVVVDETVQDKKGVVSMECNEVENGTSTNGDIKEQANGDTLKRSSSPSALAEEPVPKKVRANEDK